MSHSTWDDDPFSDYYGPSEGDWQRRAVLGDVTMIVAAKSIDAVITTAVISKHVKGRSAHAFVDADGLAGADISGWEPARKVALVDYAADERIGAFVARIEAAGHEVIGALDYRGQPMWLTPEESEERKWGALLGRAVPGEIIRTLAVYPRQGKTCCAEVLWLSKAGEGLARPEIDILNESIRMHWMDYEETPFVRSIREAIERGDALDAFVA